MTEGEIADIAITCDRMARGIGQRFVLDEWKLELAGFTREQIDRIFDRAERGSR